MIRPLAVIAAVFILSGCTSSSAPATPAPPPVENPAPTIALPPERRGRRVFAADFTGPDLGCFMEINGDVPPRDTTPPEAIWGVTDFRDGTTDPLCQPGPNVRYRCDGRLHLSAKDCGFGLVSKQTFPRTGCTSFQGEFTFMALHDGPWGGLVVYNGDAKPPHPPTVEEQMQNMWDTGQWWGAYVWMIDGAARLAVCSASSVGVESVPMEIGRAYDFRIDYDHPAGRVDFWIMAGGVALLHVTSSLEKPLNRDPVLFENDPHLALFLGGADMSVGRLDVFSDAEVV